MLKKSNGKISLLVILLVLFLIPIIYIGITYVSATSATYSISGVEFNEKILDLILNPQQVALNALVSRQVEVDINLHVEGHGFLPATIKSLTAQIFLEDTYFGAIYTDEQFTIPASGSIIVEFTGLLDLSQIGLDDIWRVANTIPTHNYEIKTAIQGDFELFLILFSLKIPISATSYTLSLTDAPQVVSLEWDSTACEVGDAVGFSVAVENVFRGSNVEGEISVNVREDIGLGFDENAQSYRYPITLLPGERKTVEGSFSSYKSSATNGFFIKVKWGTKSIGEQINSYPPRLEVIEGSLEVVDFYWSITNDAVSSGDIGDNVKAHIIIRALDARVEDRITISIRKDIPLWIDTDVSSTDFIVSLERGESKEFVLSFIPDESSGLTLRGYFVEIEGFTSWTMPNDYPPRFTVGEEQLGTPVVVNAWWTTSSGVVSSVSQGERVTGHILFKASGGEVQSQLLIYVRKDLALLPDQDLEIFSGTLNLVANQQKELTFSFDLSDSPGASFRGYFLHVDYTSIGESWTMENSYPPRLEVTEEIEEPEQPTEGTPSIVDVWWTLTDQVITSCQQDQSVSANVEIMAIGGSISGTITVRVRKDIPFLSDEDHVTRSFTVSLSEGQSGVATVTFVAEQKTGFSFRGYFIQVDFDSWDTSWTMESAYPPRLQVQ